VVAADEKEVRVADEATVSDVAEGSAEPSKAGEEEDTGAATDDNAMRGRERAWVVERSVERCGVGMSAHIRMKFSC
jgi:hypothetical protein